MKKYLGFLLIYVVIGLGGCVAKPQSPELLAAYASWQKAVNIHLREAQIRNPPKMYPKFQEGTVSVSFALGSVGQILWMRIEESSNIEALDQAVLTFIRKADTFPPPSYIIKGSAFRFERKFVFRNLAKGKAQPRPSVK